MSWWIRAASVAATALACAAAAQDSAPPVDPLTVAVDDRDARRFAELWRKTGGAPSAAQIASDYLSGAGPGVTIFTPNRIRSAENLAATVAAQPALYRQAIDTCLPWVPETNPQLRSIYLAMQGLLPDRPLPRIHLVVGAANSGGTAGAGAQVLGLEILCRDAPTRPAFLALMRSFFAHETVHTFQRQPDEAVFAGDPLLAAILNEGVADYVGSLVTGAPMSEAREAYGSANEATLWRQFAIDRAAARDGYSAAGGFNEAGQAAFDHWLYNPTKGKLPGWETDMGYWLGMRIAEAYVERTPDRRAAIRDLLDMRDPAAILKRSGYAERFRPL